MLFTFSFIFYLFIIIGSHKEFSLYSSLEAAQAMTSNDDTEKTTASSSSYLQIYTDLAKLCANEFLSVSVLLGIGSLEYSKESFKDSALFAEITTKYL
jgi:hypothetical protein